METGTFTRSAPLCSLCRWSVVLNYGAAFSAPPFMKDAPVWPLLREGSNKASIEAPFLSFLLFFQLTSLSEEPSWAERTFGTQLFLPAHTCSPVSCLTPAAGSEKGLSITKHRHLWSAQLRCWGVYVRVTLWLKINRQDFRGGTNRLE